ncbi:S-methyl-5'-thioadenosine phosphorylase [bacterium]|nr:S-methyl-5'-thioadenosine phosphorylase [bacterium]
MTKLGIIGGTGLYSLPGLAKIRERRVRTPFGAPSGPLHIGEIDGLEVVFLPRHGTHHTLLPEEINYRANIMALKQIGVTRIVSVCAVGSLHGRIHPGDFVIADQFIDRTRKGRADTFFGRGIVAHVSFAEPVCPALRAALVGAARAAGARVHDGGAYVNMEGPAFSTQAESHLYRQFGACVIGMTSLTEAKLAREAEMCYATLAAVSDYDCWNSEHASVSIDQILGTMKRNNEMTIRILAAFTRALPAGGGCACGSSLRDAILTPLAHVPPATRARLRPLLAPYLARQKRK